jgi:hypothetical protein
MRLRERLGNDRDIERSDEIHYRQLAGAEKCSIQALPRQEPLSLQKVAYQDGSSADWLPDKVFAPGDLIRLTPILDLAERGPRRMDPRAAWKS